MNWNNLFESVGNAAERKIKDMARRMTDSQLENAYYNGDNSWQVREILENEMRRRHLL